LESTRRNVIDCRHRGSQCRGRRAPFATTTHPLAQPARRNHGSLAVGRAPSVSRQPSIVGTTVAPGGRADERSRCEQERPPRVPTRLMGLAPIPAPGGRCQVIIRGPLDRSGGPNDPTRRANQPASCGGSERGRCGPPIARPRRRRPRDHQPSVRSSGCEHHARGVRARIGADGAQGCHVARPTGRGEAAGMSHGYLRG
jgi:hypothetical protein